MNVRVELWTLIGPYWRLPVRVVWNDTLAEVRVGAGARLTQRMMREADEFLAVHGTHKGSVHWVYRPNLEKVARPFLGDNPDDAVEWAPIRAKERIPVAADFQASDFIMEYCRHEAAWIRDPIFADAAWESFCKFMLHWLLNEHKTVDLMFATLDAFSLRKNWASLLMKYEYEKKGIGNMSPESYLNPDLSDMVKRGVAHFLVSRNVTALDPKTRLMKFTLECQTTAMWEKMVTRIEKVKASKRKFSSYILSYTSQQRRQLVKVLNAYAGFVKEAVGPISYLPVRNPVGNPNQSRTQANFRQALQPGSAWAPNPAVPPPEIASGEMESADAGVSSVSDLQSENENVRDSGDESVSGS